MFACDDWLAVDRGDFQTSKILKVHGEMGAVPSNLLHSNIMYKFFDDHIWLSVGLRKNRSKFSRLQRLCCCLSILFLTMISNAMWYQTEEKVATRSVDTM